MPTTKKTPSPQARKPRATKAVPTREEIAQRAYQFYLERGGAPGNAFEDWTRAERELLDSAAKPRRKTAPKTKAA